MQRSMILLALLAALALPLPAVAYNPPSTGTCMAGRRGRRRHRARIRPGARARRSRCCCTGAPQWCPPCNQLKATLFNRQDFVERSQVLRRGARRRRPARARRSSAAASRCAAIPTVILFKPDGQRDHAPARRGRRAAGDGVLQLGLAGGRPVKAVLADARAGKAAHRPTSGACCRSIRGRPTSSSLVPEAERPALLASLAAAARRRPRDDDAPVAEGAGRQRRRQGRQARRRAARSG